MKKNFFSKNFYLAIIFVLGAPLLSFGERVQAEAGLNASRFSSVQSHKNLLTEAKLPNLSRQVFDQIPIRTQAQGRHQNEVQYTEQGLFGKSAYRPSNLSYFKHRVRRRDRSQGPESHLTSVTQVDSTQITQIQDEQTLMNVFKTARDDRFLEASPFYRRPTFLYPDDGCFARAHVMNEHIFDSFKIKMTKIFVFGDLKVQTKNSEFGSVTWWYHVAPVAKVGNQIYVIDPSIEAKKPMELKEWVLSMVREVGDAQIAICDGNSYTPDEDCMGSEVSPSASAHDQQQSFFSAEWQRLLDLGRNPERELQDFPPWLENN